MGLCFVLRFLLEPFLKYLPRKQRQLNKRHRVHPVINKCNTKRWACCNYISCKSNIKSTVNSRVFSVVLDSDIKWRTTHVIYVQTWSAPGCDIEYVGQTGGALKTRFRVHLRNCKSKKLRNFLYQHFRKSGHDTDFITIQPVEHVSYDAHATNSFKLKARFIAELKWITNLQTPFPLDLIDNNTNRAIFQTILFLYVFCIILFYSHS